MATYNLDEWSGFFNAMMVNGQYDRIYNAEHFADYFANFISSGVFAQPTDQLKVSADEGLTVGIKAGKAYIKGYAYTLRYDSTITFEPNSGNASIICKVVVEYLPTERIAKIRVIEGADTVLPDNEYQLVLCSFTLPVGVSEITEAMITDRRPDEDYCGFVVGLVKQIDFKTLLEQDKAQFNEWFEEMKGQLSEDAAGSLQLQIDTLGNEFQMKINEMMKKYFDRAVYIGQCAWSIPKVLKWGTKNQYINDGGDDDGTIGSMAIYRPFTNTWEEPRYDNGITYNGTVGSTQWITGNLELCIPRPKNISSLSYKNMSLNHYECNFVSFDWFSQWFPVDIKANVLFFAYNRIFTFMIVQKKFYKQNGIVKSSWGKAMLDMYEAYERDNADRTPFGNLGEMGGFLIQVGMDIKDYWPSLDPSKLDSVISNSGFESKYYYMYFRSFMIDWSKLFSEQFLSDVDNGYIENAGRMLGVIYGNNFNWDHIPIDNVIKGF